MQSEHMAEFDVKMSGNEDDSGDPSIALKTRPKTKRPPMYKVMLLNDD